MPALPASVTLLGLCTDAQSSFLQGPATAPPHIRAALYSDATNLTSETGIDLGSHPGFHDAGDRAIAPTQAGLMGIEAEMAAVLAQHTRPLVLGGDHALTYPVVKALAAHHGPLQILHFDAHPDLYDQLGGDRLSHACPFARIMEAGLARRLVQVGIRTMNAHQQAQADRFGVEVHPMLTLDPMRFAPAFDGPVYVSFDLDVLDPAFAPGVSHHEPGGLSVREALHLLHRLPVPILGADVVEYNPRRDVHGRTAAVAAKLVKELAGLMLSP